MAGSISSVARVSEAAAAVIFKAAGRRLISSVPLGSSTARSSNGSVKRMVMMPPKVEKEESTSKKSEWMPDPVTGDFAPVNKSAEVDAALLREMLLNPRRNVRKD